MESLKATCSIVNGKKQEHDSSQDMSAKNASTGKSTFLRRSFRRSRRKSTKQGTLGDKDSQAENSTASVDDKSSSRRSMSCRSPTESVSSKSSNRPKVALKRRLSNLSLRRLKQQQRKVPFQSQQSVTSFSPAAKTAKLEDFSQSSLTIDSYVTLGSSIKSLLDADLDEEDFGLDSKHSLNGSHWDLAESVIGPLMHCTPRYKTPMDLPSKVESLSRIDSSVNPRGKSLDEGTKFSVDKSFAYLTLTRNQEYNYCQVLEAVCNPIGVPDTRAGHTPGELAEYVRQIFGIEEETHNRCLRAVKHSKPPAVSLCVTVLEARDLKPLTTNSVCDAYCVLQVKHPKGATPKGSPHASPKGSPWASPRTSPTQPRRHSSIKDPHPTLRETPVAKATTNPVWNCQIEIPVWDLQTDDLLLSMWDDSFAGSPGNETGVEAAGQRTTQRPPLSKNKHSLRNLFRHFHRISGEKSDGCLGQIKVKLKDIPVMGTEKWFDLFEDSRQKRKAQGQVKLRLQLSSRQTSDSAESDQCSIEDFNQIVHKIYQYTSNLLSFDQTDQSSDELKFFELNERSRVILDQFAIQNHFNDISQKIIELSVLLESKCDPISGHVITDALLRNVIDSAVTLYNKQQRFNCSPDGAGCQKEIIGQTELALLEQTITKYIDHIAVKISESETFPKLFPPLQIKIEDIVPIIGVSKQLLGFFMKLSKNELGDKFSNMLRDKLQADCCDWWDRKLHCIKSCDRDAVISEVKILTGVIREVTNHTSPCLSLSQYFTDMKVKYEKCVTVVLEKKVACKAQELMLRIDDYQKRFTRYRSNILDSSAATQALYNALRCYLDEIKGHFTMRELFRITVSSFQDWFEQSVTYWLQTFREEGMRRVGKALDIDKDVVQLTEGVKVSNSAVDVVSIFHKISSEWKMINFSNADIALLGATKITELICDGVQLYLDKIEDILEHNGYYDFIINQQFDVTDQLCITLNNIVHVIRHLKALPGLLRWEAVCQSMSVKYEDQSVGQRCLTTLERLTRTAHQEAVLRSKVLLGRIGTLMELDLQNYTKKFTQSQPNKPSSVDDLLEYLKTNLAVFHQKLDSRLMPSVIQDLWTRTLTVFSSTLMDGQHPDYYGRMDYHLDSLYAYFQHRGLEASVKECPSYCHLVDRIKLNTLPTEELMLMYYASLTKQISSPSGYFGYLEVKVAYQVDTNAKNTGDTAVSNNSATVLTEPKSAVVTDNNNSKEPVATLYVNVLRARQLPAMNQTEDSSNPFVSLSLCPITHFPISRNLRTTVVKGTLDPVFDVTYQYQGIPVSHLQSEGAAVIMTVWHRDPVLPCQYYLGEVIVPLNVAPCLGPLQVIDDIPASISPLQRRETPEDGPLKVLTERQKWDKVAREMVAQTKHDTGMTPAWPLCRPVAYLLNKVTGTRGEVRSQPKISGPIMYQR